MSAWKFVAAVEDARAGPLEVFAPIRLSASLYIPFANVRATHSTGSARREHHVDVPLTPNSCQHVVTQSFSH
jgi:3D (Asp-Asp-Asp) domain-containing protein